MENGEQPARPTGLELTPQVFLKADEREIVNAYDEILRRKGVRQEGLSKREHFTGIAAQALHIWLLNPSEKELDNHAKVCVTFADLLLKALSNKQP